MRNVVVHPVNPMPGSGQVKVGLGGLGLGLGTTLGTLGLAGASLAALPVS